MHCGNCEKTVRKCLDSLPLVKKTLKVGHMDRLIQVAIMSCEEMLISKDSKSDSDILISKDSDSKSDNDLSAAERAIMIEEFTRYILDNYSKNIEETTDCNSLSPEKEHLTSVFTSLKNGDSESLFMYFSGTSIAVKRKTALKNVFSKFCVEKLVIAIEDSAGFETGEYEFLTE